MNRPIRSLLAFASVIAITLGISGCGGGFRARFAFLQESDVPGVSQATKSATTRASLQSRHTQTHVQAASKKIGVEAAVDIGSGFFDVLVGDLSGNTRLLAVGFDILNIQLSQDGKKVVFTAWDNDTEAYQVYVGDSKLNTVTQLTFDPEDHFDAAFSPDGNTVVYDSFDSDIGWFALFTVPAAGGFPTIVDIGNQEFDAFFPTFTPDGQQLVFTAFDGEAGLAVLAIVDVAGSNADPLTNFVDNQFDGYPSVSSDGSVITFTRADDLFIPISAAIYQIPITGEPVGGATALTVDDAINWQAQYTNNRIVFLSDRSGNQNIWKMNSDGSSQVQLLFSVLDQFFNFFD